MKFIVMTVCGIIFFIGLIIRAPAWVLAGAGGAFAAIFLPD